MSTSDHQPSAAFTTAFIGAGNMAYSIVSGLLAAGTDPARLRAADPSADKHAALKALGLSYVGGDNAAAVQGADVIVLAIKPQVMREVCEALAPAVNGEQLVISIAAGVGADSLQDWLGDSAGTPSIVRCMPNTPSLLRAGAAALFAHGSLGDRSERNDRNEEQRSRAEAILGAVGTTCWVNDEQQLHAVTAVSGSGPAYFFLLMEAMIAESERLGLDAQTATELCAQTCIGAGRMLAEGDVDAAELRRRVTSPGGTTERAIATFLEGDFDALVHSAMRACAERSAELAKELG